MLLLYEAHTLDIEVSRTLLEQSHVDAARPGVTREQTACTEVGLHELIADALPGSDPASVEGIRDTLLRWWDTPMIPSQRVSSCTESRLNFHHPKCSTWTVVHERDPPDAEGFVI